MRLKIPASCFGRRLREARLRADIPQDKLGVAIGLDEGTASARISRYETGTHAPPYDVAQEIAKVVRVPVAYLSWSSFFEHPDRESAAQACTDAGLSWHCLSNSAGLILPSAEFRRFWL